MSRTLVAVMLLSSSLSSCVRVIEHKQANAARAAERFSETAFGKQNYAAAHGLLTPAGQEGIPLEKLTKDIAKMHPAAFPKTVKAVEYEPMPGQTAMQIFLRGTADDEEFYYRLVMVGDKHSGYQVSEYWRGSGPHPPSSRKPL